MKFVAISYPDTHTNPPDTHTRTSRSLAIPYIDTHPQVVHQMLMTSLETENHLSVTFRTHLKARLTETETDMRTLHRRSYSNLGHASGAPEVRARPWMRRFSTHVPTNKSTINH